MSPVRNKLINMIDCLPDKEQKLIFEIVKRFIPDDIATPEDLADIKAANEAFARGEYTRHEDIKWD